MGNSPSSFAPSQAEDETWAGFDFTRFMDDAYVAEWNKRNDLAQFLEKEQKKQVGEREVHHPNDSETEKAACLVGAGAAGTLHVQRTILQQLKYVSESSVSLEDLDIAVFSPVPSRDQLQKQHAQIKRRNYYVVETARKLLLQRVHLALQQEAKNSAVPATKESKSSATEERLFCPKLHVLRPHVTTGGSCDGCGMKKAAGTAVLDCRPCNYWLCEKCQEAKVSPEVEKLPVSQRLGLKLIVSLLQFGAATVEQTNMVLSHLIPLLDVLLPNVDATSDRTDLGVLDAVGEDRKSVV